MTDSEVNKIIAEFMGEERITCPSCKYQGYDYENLYTNSLDALVPVWEKLGNAPIECIRNNFKDDNSYLFYLKNRKFEIIGESYGETIQQAAVYATAKAIMELKK